MKRICIIALVLFGMMMLCGCDQVMEQMETAAAQIDVEAVVTEVIENIDWAELKDEAQKGYDALVERFPALKSENIKGYLKDNGLELLNRYIESGDEAMQENARKLGQIIQILDPELADEVTSVIGE